MCLEVMTDIVIHFYANTTLLRKSFNLAPPALVETFHTQSLLQKRPFNFVIRFLKIYFKDDSIKLLRVTPQTFSYSLGTQVLEEYVRKVGCRPGTSN